MVVNQFDDNQALWAAGLNALSNATGGSGIVSGCSISKGAGDWDIDVTSGTIIESNDEASITSDTVTITDASGLTSGESRVTLIHADTGDAIASTDGSAAADPASPDIPASEVLLGFVVVAEGDSTVADSDIIDIPALNASGGQVPADIITMFSGAIVDIPSGWVLCDGNNGTPNLQDKFVVGAGNTYAVDATGGESTHTLTESELASHTHTYDKATGSSASSGGAADIGSSSRNTGSTGGDSAHENKPPYHALAYVMKV